MPAPPVIPQGNFSTNQNYDPAIRDMFKDFVTGANTANANDPGETLGIDDIRGQISASVTNTNTANLIASLNLDSTSTTPAPTPNTTTPVIRVQESRCHAFYRILGFPVINNNQSGFYNPGFDIVKQPGVTRTVTLAYKKTVASNVGTAFQNISAAREKWAASTAQVFSNPNSIQAGVLALTSGTYGQKGNVNVRKFAAPFLNGNKEIDPFDFNADHQTYATVSQTSLIGNAEVLLSDYQDANLNTISTNNQNTNIFFQHEHIIVPFMVDPRIDFSIWSAASNTFSGVSKRVAVPFVPDASFLQVSNTSTATRPLLEKIITDRISQYNQSVDAGQAISNAVSYIKSNKSIQGIQFIGNTSLGDIFSSKIFKTSQQSAFALYLSIIQAMMSSLKNAINTVSGAQGKYYWVPIPSVMGPEGGSSIGAVPVNANINPTLITRNDFDIIYNQSQVLISNVNIATTQANAVPDKGGYAFNTFYMTFDSGTSDSQGDLSTKNMNNMNDTRNDVLTKASDALQIIEMIMGEFNGLGLSDIIAIMGSLYTMPLENVLGFLDADALIRAQNTLNQSKPFSPAPTNIVTSMNALAESVNAFYSIMDNVFQDYINNNAQNL
jgi:hypothetical protein